MAKGNTILRTDMLANTPAWQQPGRQAQNGRRRSPQLPKGTTRIAERHPNVPVEASPMLIKELGATYVAAALSMAARFGGMDNLRASTITAIAFACVAAGLEPALVFCHYGDGVPEHSPQAAKKSK